MFFQDKKHYDVFFQDIDLNIIQFPFKKDHYEIIESFNVSPQFSLIHQKMTKLATSTTLRCEEVLEYAVRDNIKIIPSTWWLYIFKIVVGYKFRDQEKIKGNFDNPLEFDFTTNYQLWESHLDIFFGAKYVSCISINF